jgi:hypothetical protein
LLDRPPQDPGLGRDVAVAVINIGDGAAIGINDQRLFAIGIVTGGGIANRCRLERDLPIVVVLPLVVLETSNRRAIPIHT